MFALGTLLLASSVTTAAPARAAALYSEQQGHHGVNTFTNYHNASGMGPRIEPGAWVQVSCKVLDTTIVSANPDGYWYRIASPPWNDQYYSPANTFMNGDPWNGPYAHNTDFAVPDCGAPQSPPPPPPAPSPSVTLAQGPAAPAGYRYAITLDHFAGNSSVSISCHDSVDPGGFLTFSLATDGNGHGSTQSQCYSGDGPDHWVIADGSVESNHVTWTVPTAPAPSPQPGPPTPNPEAAPAAPSPTPSPTGVSVFYSGTNVATGVRSIEPANQNIAYDQWTGNCSPGNAYDAVNFDKPITTLAGWSKGRLGVIYFLIAADQATKANIRRIVLIDPGSTADFAEPTGWRGLFKWAKDTCDYKLGVNKLLADWLASNPDNRLIVYAGHDSEEKPGDDPDAEPTYAGLWKYYFADIWKQDVNHALVCHYDGMEHEDVLRNAYKAIKSTDFSCLPHPSLTAPWNP